MEVDAAGGGGSGACLVLLNFIVRHRADHIHWICWLDAIESIGKFGAQAKPAVPMLIELLNDPQPAIRAAAANALKAIDPAAAAKADVK